MDLKYLFLESEDLISPGISACQGCAAEYCLRTVLKVLGRNTILAVPPGCMAGAGVVGWNRNAGTKVPVTIPLLDNSASMMSGLGRYYKSVGRDDIQIVVFAGDGATADAGFQSLSGVAERGENIIYICYDNEGYMNTGFQRSGTTTKGSNTSTTPVGSVNKGKLEHKKDVPMLMAMHNPSYVATVSPGYPKDFVGKIEKAASVRKGFVYLHIFSPCPTGWRFSPERTFQIARLGVQTNFFPLWEYENGRFKQSLPVRNPKPVKEYMKNLGKFSHLTEKQINEIQQWVDWKNDVLQCLFSSNSQFKV